jgi:predicted metal-dependent TIM-barrel fold hydrolase
LAVPEFVFEMKKRGHSLADIDKVVFQNPLTFFRQCRRFAWQPPAITE